MFEHYLNSLRINFWFRLQLSPCLFIEKIMKYILLSSVFLREVSKLCFDKYQIDDLLDNDKQAVVSRIAFVQNHESQMRGPVHIHNEE